MNGIIIDLKGGLYKVKDLDSEVIFSCKGRGNLRHNNISPVVGDYVVYSVSDNEKLMGMIESVNERKNKLERPNVANIDYALVVSSVTEPYLNDLIIDKMLMQIELNKIEPVLILTKIDLLENLKEKKINLVKEKIGEYKRLGYKVIESSVDSLIDNDLKSILKKNTVSVITGQTGVGKSTLLNKINSNLNLKTDEISKSLGRGKHTTRHVELHELFKNTYIIDTPGFSSFEISEIILKEHNYDFTPFKDYAGECKFRDCIHYNEPKCKIREAVSEKKIPERYYNNYLKIFNLN